MATEPPAPEGAPVSTEVGAACPAPAPPSETPRAPAPDPVASLVEALDRLNRRLEKLERAVRRLAGPPKWSTD